MKLSREDIETIKEVLNNDKVREIAIRAKAREMVTNKIAIISNLIETVEALHTSIEALANSFEAQGRVAEAKEIKTCPRCKGLGYVTRECSTPCNQDDVICFNCLCEYVEREEPEYAHTFDWEEHPEDYEDICYCQECLDAMAN